METIEIVIYVAIAVIVGGIVTSFIAGLSPNEIYDSLKNVVFGSEELTYENVDTESLALNAYRVWERCGFGATPYNLTLYFSQGDEASRTSLFKIYKKLNLCYSIQSGNESCGTREDLNISGHSIQPPAVVVISCDTQEKKLRLS